MWDTTWLRIVRCVWCGAIIIIIIIYISVISSYLLGGGGKFPPPQNPKFPPPPQKNTQNTKNIKKCIEFTPQICVPPRTWSLEFIIIISLTSIFFQDKSRVWTAASQQHLVDNQPLATFWDLPFSRSDASISRNPV